MHTPHSSPKSNLIKGAFWALATRWSIRIAGFINTIIMARLLMPSDYGLVAMATLVVGLAQALLDSSATTALMRKEKITKSEINSTWTLRLIQCLAMAAVVALAAPISSVYFQDQRVESILYVLSICVLISAFSNIGLAIAYKEFNYSLDFKHQLYTKIIGIVVTIAFGFWLRDYRALVAGIASGYISGTLLSYSMHNYRPKLCLKEIPEVWSLTKWILATNIANFTMRKGDELIASRIGTSSEYGQYYVGADLGQLPTGEIGPAILKSLLPVLSSIEDTTDKINIAVIKTIRTVAALTLPIGFGFSAIAPQATTLLLGNNWETASAYVAAFSVLGAIQVLGKPINTLLTLRGHTKIISNSAWIEFAAFLGAGLVLVQHHNLIGLVYAKIFASITNLCITVFWGNRKCSLDAITVGTSFIRPLSGAIGMYIAVSLTLNHLSSSAGVEVATGIAVGFFTYSTWSLASWRLAGKPEGLESTIIDLLKKSTNK